MGIFKAYDIRGIHPTELDAELARKIGRAFSSILDPGQVIVARDARVHSPEIAEAVRWRITRSVRVRSLEGWS